MSILVNLIIVFLFLFIIYVIFFKNIVKEGYKNEYQPYDENAMILAEKKENPHYHWYGSGIIILIIVYGLLQKEKVFFD